MGTAAWAFDAVYTPVETQFLNDARATNLEVMSGYELYFHQGVDAFRLFTRQQMRNALLQASRSLRSGCSDHHAAAAAMVFASFSSRSGSWRLGLDCLILPMMHGNASTSWQLSL